MIDIRRPCTYSHASIVACNESDISKLAWCHYKSDCEYHHANVPHNFQSVLAGLWQRIFNNAADNPVVFKAVSGGDVVGACCATNRVSTHLELAKYCAEIHILRVLKDAQRHRIGRRLLACTAGNLYANGSRSAYMVVDRSDHETSSFCRATGGIFKTVDVEQGMLVFAWDNLISLINQ